MSVTLMCTLAAGYATRSPHTNFTALTVMAIGIVA
eukprot:CAMPEP_0179419324 /NCGR_PEP_ID=MMETSP0799-20121207/8529_1 /TAXON_ID=46947 /ORGANISM="Geminigera cryophila, Strain CCMP2564" /LENGTH=34 /DNA_ID= /DNA_START= /DNA_END= /DNA_ORIENTATION=